MFGQLFDAREFFLSVGFVVQFFRGDDVTECQKKRHIRSWPDGMPLMGKASSLGKPGIKDNDFAPVFLCGHQVYAVRCDQGFKRISSDNDDVFGMKNVREWHFAKSVQISPVPA